MDPNHDRHQGGTVNYDDDGDSDDDDDDHDDDNNDDDNDYDDKYYKSSFFCWTIKVDKRCSRAFVPLIQGIKKVGMPTVKLVLNLTLTRIHLMKTR